MTRRQNPEPTVEVYRDRHGDIADVTVRLAGGSVSAIRSRFDKPDVMHVGWSELPESARGKGLGVQMYAALMDWALANNITLTSDEALSPAAGRVWEALAKRGYPIQKHPTARLYTEDDRSAWGADDRNKPFTLHRRNPRPTTAERTDLSPRLTARRTDPVLWEAVKREVTAGSKGGMPGEWSARKAQLAVALYKKRGGGYVGPKSPRNALAKWTREDWRTRSGKPSLVTGERYLPARAIEALTPAEYAATSRAKRAGLLRDEQFTPQPERIAEKTARYRKNPAGKKAGDKVPARLLMPTEDEQRAFEEKVREALLLGGVARPRVVSSVALVNTRPPRYLPSVVVHLRDDDEYERARSAALSRRFASVAREYGEGAALRLTQLGKEVSPLRGNPTDLAPCMVTPAPLWLADATFIARLRTPSGRIVDVLSDTKHGGMNTWLTAEGDRSCVLGKARHSDECAPRADVPGDGAYRRIHTAKGVGQTGAGLGFALYLGSALAAEYMGDRGVFSIPLTVPRRETRSGSADALWKKLLGGTRPLARTEQGWVYCCSDADFTAAERRTKVYKDWLKSESEEGVWMRRDIDVLAGEDVRRSGFVVALGKAAVTPTLAALEKDYNAALTSLQSVFASLSEAEQARIVDADNEFHAGKPEAFVRWARTLDPALFPSFGAAEVERPWADFAGALASNPARRARGAQPERIREKTARYRRNPPTATLPGGVDAFLADFYSATLPSSHQSRVFADIPVWVYVGRHGDDGADLHGLEAFPGVRGTGAGTRAMQRILDLADKHGVRVFLDAAPSDEGWSAERLIRWYSSFGFMLQDADTLDTSGYNYMVREPHAKGPRRANPARIKHNPRRRNPTRREAEAIRAIRANLTPDLLAGEYRACATSGPVASSPAAYNPVAGHCAVATEALYFMLGGKAAGYTPMNVRHPVKGNARGVSHWYLRTPDGRYLDPTADQFDTPVDYASGRGRGFPTPKQGHAEPPPSKRAAMLLRRVGQQG